MIRLLPGMDTYRKRSCIRSHISLHPSGTEGSRSDLVVLPLKRQLASEHVEGGLICMNMYYNTESSHP